MLDLLVIWLFLSIRKSAFLEPQRHAVNNPLGPQVAIARHLAPHVYSQGQIRGNHAKAFPSILRDTCDIAVFT